MITRSTESIVQRGTVQSEGHDEIHMLIDYFWINWCKLLKKFVPNNHAPKFHATL